MAPVDRVLTPGDCRRITDDVAVHWFPDFADGTPCYCGAVTRTLDERAAQAATTEAT